jgi:hypothetical protein
VIAFSSKTGAGSDEVWKKIRECVKEAPG